MLWAYGVTTVPSRKDSLLSRTLKSLEVAGFNEPRLFVDGVGIYEDQYKPSYEGRPTAIHCPPVGSFGNWVLAMWELWIRDPHADLYALFQDDLVAMKNVRQYVESTQWRLPALSYLNLHTFMSNEQVISNKSVSWYESGQIGGGNTERRQTGRSALALVFNNRGVEALLTSSLLVGKPKWSNYSTTRIDGDVCHAMNLAGYREYIHNPSLVMHTGQVSVIKSQAYKAKHKVDEPMDCGYPPAQSFLGEAYDALEFLPNQT